MERTRVTWTNMQIERLRKLKTITELQISEMMLRRAVDRYVEAEEQCYKDYQELSPRIARA